MVAPCERRNFTVDSGLVAAARSRAVVSHRKPRALRSAALEMRNSSSGRSSRTVLLGA